MAQEIPSWDVKLGSDNTSMYNFTSIYGGETHVIISTPNTWGLLEQGRVELNSVMWGDSASEGISLGVGLTDNGEGCASWVKFAI